MDTDMPTPAPTPKPKKPVPKKPTIAIDPIEAINAKLLAIDTEVAQALARKKDLVAQRKREEDQAELSLARTADTRKKILVGAFYLHKERSPEERARVTAAMDDYLTRDEDRALFDLPLLAGAA